MLVFEHKNCGCSKKYERILNRVNLCSDEHLHHLLQFKGNLNTQRVVTKSIFRSKEAGKRRGAQGSPLIGLRRTYEILGLEPRPAACKTST